MHGLAAPPGLVALLRSLSPRSSGERATASGAVSAGSNPAGGTVQRHKFEHSDNLESTGRQACDLRQRGAVPDLVCPIRAPTPPPDPRVPLLNGSSHSRSPHRSVTADRCSWHLCCSYAATRGHSPVAAKDVPPAILARPACQKETTSGSGRNPAQRRLDCRLTESITKCDGIVPASRALTAAMRARSWGHGQC